MKCPRCQNEVNPNDNYCPHCGYQLKNSNGNNGRPPRQRQIQLNLMSVILILMAAIIIPIASIYYSMQTFTNTTTDNYSIGDVNTRLDDSVIYTFDSLDEFRENISNASDFINPMSTYTKSLSNDDYQFTDSYHIEVCRNSNVIITITSVATISDNETYTIQREYDRIDKDIITKTYTKNNLSSFDDLLLDYSEPISQIMNEKTYTTLLNDMKKKEKTFNNTKDHIGHYGIGVYSNKAGYIVKQDYSNKNYKVSIKNQTDGDGSLR